jgi:hypothetical protein
MEEDMAAIFFLVDAERTGRRERKEENTGKRIATD